MSTLKPYNGKMTHCKGPRVSTSLVGENLSISFELELFESPFVDAAHAEEFKNWGLWETDVFEAFLTKSDSRLPYLEIQVSPLNQKFALLVQNPRVETSYPEALPFESESSVESSVEGETWKARMKVPLSQIPGQGDIVMGNLHAIIGKERNHFSLNLSESAKVKDQPDFHRPEKFIDLVQNQEGA